MDPAEYFGDPNKIDIQYDDQEGGTHLVFCCAGHVDGSPETQKALLDKLEGYFRHIASAPFQARYQHARIFVELSFEEEPDELILQLLYRCAPWAADNGAELRFRFGGRDGKIVETANDPPARTTKGEEGMDRKALSEQFSSWNEAGEFDKIIEAAQAVPAEERDYELSSWYGRALSNAGRYPEALAQFDALAEEGEADPYYHGRRGYVLFHQERYEEAQAEFTRAAALAPEDDADFIDWCRTFLAGCEAGGPQEFTPELYEEEEAEALEDYIAARFGSCESVYHELFSPDLHIDLYPIPPTPERGCYTVVTLGMGAHHMRVPEELEGKGFDRAELLIRLPPDWEFGSEEERWYWPLRWLKLLARLPAEEDSWLGFGHTIAGGGPFAEDTALCGMMLVFPEEPEDIPDACTLPNGELVNFYQLIPLYKEEMDYKQEHGAEALLDLLGDAVFAPVDPRRPNVCL